MLANQTARDSGPARRLDCAIVGVREMRSLGHSAPKEASGPYPGDNAPGDVSSCDWANEPNLHYVVKSNDKVMVNDTSFTWDSREPVTVAGHQGVIGFVGGAWYAGFEIGSHWVEAYTFSHDRDTLTRFAELVLPRVAGDVALPADPVANWSPGADPYPPGITSAGGPAATTIPSATPSSPGVSSAEALVEQWKQVNATCRGSTGSESDTACTKRDDLDRQLDALDWCFGKDSDKSMAEASWHRCGPGSQHRR